jgi:hypothetical protein
MPFFIAISISRGMFSTAHSRWTMVFMASF